MEKLRLFELFRGYGSQALALKKYGIEFENVGGCEIDKYADIAHEAIHGYVKNFGDITKVIASELPYHDLCTYSFPCQSISMAGKQEGLSEGSGTRSSLLWECERIIKAKMPKFLTMENVKNLISKKHKPDFDKWLMVLNNLGYNNYWKVINAKHCGIPQNRERVFCVSIRKDIDDGLFEFEDDFDSGVRLKDVLESKVDEKYYLTGNYLVWWNKNKDFQLKKAYSSLNNDIAICLAARQYASWNGNYVDGKINCFTESRTEEAKKIRRESMKNGIDFSPRRGKYLKLRDDEMSNCITTSITKEHSLLLLDGIRKLTPKECFRLMGVSDEDINKMQSSGISNSQQYKLAGNSIVVNSMAFLKNLPICKSK